MKKVLITGATGNIGQKLIQALISMNAEVKIVAGVRNIDKAKQQLLLDEKISFIHFDFMNPSTFSKALKGIDQIFLLRPPHISDIEKYFNPLIISIKEAGITEIIFLSVQGAEKSNIIPHNKIESLIREYDIDHIFLRPSYFMQNLTTTLLDDIKHKKAIILPSGKAKFNWIDINNIAEVTAIVMNDFSNYLNREIELTGYQNLDFYEVVKLIRKHLTISLHYQNVSPFKFYKIKKQDKIEKGLILVMLMLHFLPRIQKPPQISENYELITGKSPTDLSTFIQREKNIFMG